MKIASELKKITAELKLVTEDVDQDKILKALKEKGFRVTTGLTHDQFAPMEEAEFNIKAVKEKGDEKTTVHIKDRDNNWEFKLEKQKGIKVTKPGYWSTKNTDEVVKSIHYWSK